MSEKAQFTHFYDEAREMSEEMFRELEKRVDPKDDAYVDMAVYGVSVFRGPERVDPRSVYIVPENDTPGGGA